MEQRSDLQSWQPPFRLYLAVYLMMMLLSLDGFHAAEVAARDHGWYLKVILGVPWFFGLMAGVAHWIGRKRRVMDDQMAGSIIFVFGVLIEIAYEGMGKLAGLIR